MTDCCSFTTLAAIASVLSLCILRYFGILGKLSRRWFAFVMSVIANPLDKCLKNDKEHIFQGLHETHKKQGKLTILEIGSGTCINFPYFPEGSKVFCVEPNEYFSKYAALSAKKYEHVECKQVVAPGESMPMIQDASIDAVICTLVLCSVTDVAQVLKEISRILKPNGKFYYVEHIMDKPGTFRYYMQHLFWLPWSILNDGCLPNRNTDAIIQQHGFSHVDQYCKMIDGAANILKPHVVGVCTK